MIRWSRNPVTKVPSVITLFTECECTASHPWRRDGWMGWRNPCPFKVPQPSFFLKANDICRPKVLSESQAYWYRKYLWRKVIGTHEIICTATHNPKCQSPPRVSSTATFIPRFCNTSTPRTLPALIFPLLLVFPWCSIFCHVTPTHRKMKLCSWHPLDPQRSRL